jgi:diguanylate cyclase (GGDEF)-like protein
MARGSIFGFSAPRPGTEVPLAASETNEFAALVKNFEETRVGWFWTTDAEGRLTYISTSLAEDLGCATRDLLGSPLAGLFEPQDDSASVRDRLPFVISRQADFDKLTLRLANSTQQRSWQITGRGRTDASGTFKGYLGYSIDVTEQLRRSQSASRLAMFDALTGLPNRHNMTQFLETHTVGLERYGRSCAVIMIDLDRFKAVNDSLGHPVGDALLKQVANRLLKTIKDKEKIFRLGGDEFQIILPNVSDRDQLNMLAHDIIRTLSQPYSIDGNRCDIGASVGVAIGPEDGVTREHLMRNADLALYAAKDSGRGCCRFFSTSMLQVAEDRRSLEEDLRTALDKGELSLFYQPIVNSKTNTVTGVEALVRWKHPTRGQISPALFIPIAEEANLILHLGEWILRKACADAAIWPPHIRVAVNVSPIQFANQNLPTIVMSALASSGIAPDRLELELTEGIFLTESAETDAMFDTLKEIGVRLALDDFGTGYSSLGYLKTAPFDKIKIDQTFVHGATMPGSRNAAIIAAIVALAGALDMETTAEGIESFDQLDLIHALGVSHVQGYIYSKPIAYDEMTEKLSAGEWTIGPKGPSKQRSEWRSLYRKVGAILKGHYHPVVMRSLSETGAFIEGLPDAPVGTQVIIDFGGCQLTIATVRRVDAKGHGVEFLEPLVKDDVGGLRTRTLVNPYSLAKQGLSSSSHIESARLISTAGAGSISTLADALGLNQTPGGGAAWSAERGEGGGRGSRNVVADNPLQNMSLQGLGIGTARCLKPAEWERLKKALEESNNPQLRNIIAIVVLTGARIQELLSAVWSHVDFEARIWTIPALEGGQARQIRLPMAAIELLETLPRVTGCEHLIINPRTKKPYNSVFGSWDAARRKAGLESLSVHDLRNSIKRTW